MALPQWAFLRRTGSGKGKRIRAESRQYGPSDPAYERVRAYRRRHPDPPGPRTPGKVRVHAYIRHRRLWALGRHDESESQTAWIRYLADFHHISMREARRMERETRP